MTGDGEGGAGSGGEEYSPEQIRRILGSICESRTRGELVGALLRELHRYTLFDLQIIGGRMNAEIERLPSPYREAVRPYFRDQIFLRHHQILALERGGQIPGLSRPIRDREAFGRFCAMVPEGCFAWDDAGERNPYFRNPKNRLFYYLIAAFTMFVLDEPGHPVGMPFPGGFAVERRGKDFYCLIRDKEKDVFWSICNFCPALQSGEGK